MLIHSCQILGLMMHLIFGLARRPTTLLMMGFREVVRMSMMISEGRDKQNRPWEQIAINPATLFQRYHLNPITRPYVCCPKCFALYSPHEAPSRCTYQEFEDEGKCGAELSRTRTIGSKTHTIAARIYLHQEMKEWIGRLLSRPDIDELLDKPRDPRTSKYMEDICHGSILEEFMGPDGLPYLTTRLSDGSVLKLVFSLGIDGFNSYRNMQAKQQSSSTGMYMVCLNLPPEVRYLPENIYLVGVIPGPNKPSLDQLNHTLELLVKDLNQFWTPGVYYNRTARHRNGRLVNAVLIPLVSDLVAARQVSGFGSHRHRFFCSCCYLMKDDIEDFDPSRWPPRTSEIHREVALEWKNARSADERQKLFERYGVRWSALLNLPYWNPILFTVLDSMHNLYLGIIQNHIRWIWGISITAKDGEGYTDPSNKPPPRPDVKKMEMANVALTDRDYKGLLVMDASVLWHLCADRDLRRTMKNKKIALQHLKAWVRTSLVCYTRYTTDHHRSASHQLRKPPKHPLPRTWMRYKC